MTTETRPRVRPVWDEPSGAASPRGWLTRDGYGCVGFYLDYGPDNYRPGHVSDIGGGRTASFCQPGRLCRDCQPGDILAARYPNGPSTDPFESRYVETIAQAREYVETGHVKPGRRFDAGRKAQGFRSQAHLDAFYAHYDHSRSCAECQKPGRPMWLEGSASWQPTSAICAEGRRLRDISDGFTVPRDDSGERERQAAESITRLARYARGDVGYRLLG